MNLIMDSQNQENQNQEEQNQETQEQSQAAIMQEMQRLQQELQQMKESKSSQNQEVSQEQEQKEQERLQQEADLKRALSGEAKEKGIDFDELSNNQLLDVIGEAFEKATQAKTNLASSQFEKTYESLEKKLENLERALIQKEVSSDIENVRNQNPDFDNYRQDMAKIFEKYPGISAREAYILAKGSKVGNTPPQKETETEKPVSLSTRAERAEKRFNEKKSKNSDEGTPRMSGRNFRNFVKEVAENMYGND